MADTKLEYMSPTWLTPYAPPDTEPPIKNPIKVAPATSLEISMLGSIRCKLPSRYAVVSPSSIDSVTPSLIIIVAPVLTRLASASIPVATNPVAALSPRIAFSKARPPIPIETAASVAATVPVCTASVIAYDSASPWVNSCPVSGLVESKATSNPRS